VLRAWLRPRQLRPPSPSRSSGLSSPSHSPHTPAHTRTPPHARTSGGGGERAAGGHTVGGHVGSASLASLVVASAAPAASPVAAHVQRVAREPAAAGDAEAVAEVRAVSDGARGVYCVSYVVAVAGEYDVLLELGGVGHR
jgi:hypothetical protein